MPTLPETIIAILAPFASLFSVPVFRHVQILVAGALMTRGRHTVTNALRLMGLADCSRFQCYHRVLNRAKWNPRHAAKILLRLLVTTLVPLVPKGEIVFGIDETLERRRGKKIKAKGIYRDAARSSKSFFVKSSGLRWISLMLFAWIPSAKRIWALPFLTVLAPSERYNKEHRRRHKTIVDWARQMACQLRRWLPGRTIILVGDDTYSVLNFLDRCNRMKEPITVVTRLRLDAALYEPPPERKPGQNGRPRIVGARVPKLEALAKDEKVQWRTIIVPRWYSQENREVEVISASCLWRNPGQTPVPIRYVLIRDPKGKFDTQALLCTNLSAEPVQILAWFVQRWQMEETFQEVRTHLGVETQRQWTDLAIARTTPALMGLFSLVTIAAHRLEALDKLTLADAAWYHKESVTFSDAIAAVRREIWHHRLFGMSPSHTDMTKLGTHAGCIIQALCETLCYAA
jgi:DDE superfamily endonuclease